MKCSICGAPSVWSAEDVLLCAMHFAVVKTEMWETIPPRVIDRPHAVVYYAQIYEHGYLLGEIHKVPEPRKQTYVKIGTTINLAQRIRALEGRLLVTEPGHYYRERKRLAEFTEQRIGNNEVFVVDDRIRAHIVTLRGMEHWRTHGPRELASVGQAGDLTQFSGGIKQP